MEDSGDYLASDGYCGDLDMSKETDFSDLRKYLEDKNAPAELEALDRIEKEMALERELERLRKIEKAAILAAEVPRSSESHGLEALRKVLREAGR